MKRRASGPELFPQDAVFLLKIVNDIALPLVHPTGKRDQDEPQRMRQRRHGVQATKGWVDENYAIGMFLRSLEPPKNPNPLSPQLVTRSEQIFRCESCVNCHMPPNYTSGKLTLAQGWQPPSDHPNQDDVVPVSVGTDPALALKTRKGRRAVPGHTFGLSLNADDKRALLAFLRSL